MKKFRIALLAAICLLFGILGFTACEVVPDNPDTSTSSVSCTHKLEKHGAVNATCTQTGNIEYWTCSECGKYYKDAEAKQEIAATAIIMAKTPHTEAADWTIDKEATCSTKGEKHLVCTVCNQTIKTEEIPATGHTEVEVKGKAATCTEKGLTDGKKCSVCGTVTVAQREIPATGHTEVEVKGKAATCTEKGLTDGKKCSVCGTVTVAQREIPATGHTEAADWTIDKEATCEETGSQHKECTVCHTTTKTETIPAKGHTEERMPAVAANCTSEGLTEGIRCAVCKKVIKAQEKTQALGHKPAEAWIVDKEATCEEAGSQHKECTVCHQATETAEIPAKGHTEVVVKGKAATCTETGLADGKQCSVCGTVTVAQSEIPATGHTGAAEWTIDKEATCEEAGSQHKECTVCHQVTETEEIRAKGHTEAAEWTIDKEATCEETGSRHKECRVCHTTTKTETIPAKGHTKVVVNGKKATCTEDGLTDGMICSVCNKVLEKQTVLQAEGHDYSVTEETKATCEAAGEKTYTCRNCGDSYTETVSALGHKYESVVTAATCTEDGYTTYTCVNCKDTYTGDVVKATGHNYKSAATPATCTEDGYTTYTCVNCKDTYTGDVVKATGHKTSEGWKQTESKQEGCILTITETATCDLCQQPMTRSHQEEKHNYVGSIKTPATCSAPGVMSYECSVCHEAGEDKTIERDENAHKWVLSEDGTTSTCEYCQKTKTVQKVDSNETEVDTNVEEIQMKDASVAMDEDVKKSLEAVGDVSLSVEKKDKDSLDLDEDVKKQIGDAPVYDFNLTAKSEEGETGKKVTFEGSMTITVPYTLSAGEDPETVGVYYITDEGKLEFIQAKYYEVDGEGFATFTTTHFSYYTVVRMSAAEACQQYGHKEFTQTVPATCTKDGYTVTTCTRCGETVKAKEVLSAFGHDYKAKVTDPTCTRGGYTTFTCTRCKDHYNDNYKDALGHKDVAGETKEATCTAMGYTTYTCERCDRSYKSDYKNPTGHNFVESEELSKPATCTASGAKVEVCSTCGATISTPIPATGHKYEPVVTDPTCTEGGYTTYTCKNCDAHYVSDYTSATGHNFVESEELSKAATCTASGAKVEACSTCGATISTPIPATGHKYEPVVTDPTCTEGGYTTYTCSVCGDSYVSDYTSAAGHKYEAVATDPTCTEGGYTTYTCKNCDAHYVSDYTSAAGHDYKAVVTNPTCTEGGYTTYTCSVCDVSYVSDYTPAKGHHYGGNGVCSDCGYGCTHVYGEYVYNDDATCTKNGTMSAFCAVCGYTDTVEAPNTKLPHTYVSKVTKEATCEEKGERTYTCSACGDSYTEEIEAKGHVEVTVNGKSATCTEDGLSEGKKCSVCGKVLLAQEKIDALGHDYSSEETVSPTCKEPGERTYTCTRCGHSYTESIAKIPHNYVDGVCTMCGETEPAPSVKGYYETLLESMASAKKVMIEIKDFRFEMYNGDSKQYYTCDLARLVLGVDDNGMLYGKAEGIVLFKMRGSTETATFRAVIKDNVVYFEAVDEQNFEDTTQTMPMSGEILIEALLDSVVSGMTGGMDLGSLVQMLEAYRDTFEKAEAILRGVYDQNAALIEKYLEKNFDGLFTRTESEDGYLLALDFEKVLALNEKFCNATIEELFDDYFGEGALEKVYDYIVGVADKKIAAVADEIIDFADSYGLKVADVYELIEDVVYKTTGQQISVDETVKQYYDLTVRELLAKIAGGENGDSNEPQNPTEAPAMQNETENTEGEQPAFDYTEFVKQAYDMLKQITVYQLLAQSMGGGSGSSDPAQIAQTIYQQVNEVVSVVKDYVSLTIATDKTGKVASVRFTLDALTIGGGASDNEPTTDDEPTDEKTDTDTIIGGTLVITPDGDFTIDFETLPEEVQAILKGIVFEDGGEFNGYAVSVDEEGNVYFTRSYGETMRQELEDPVQYEGVEYKGVLVMYQNCETVSATLEDLFLAEYMPDCGDWYNISYLMNGTYVEKNGIFIQYYTAEGEFVAEESYLMSGMEGYQGRITTRTSTVSVSFYYNPKTGVISSLSHHDYKEDESRHIIPENCEDSEIRVYVCTICHDEQVSRYYQGHSTKTVVELQEGSVSCEDGVIVKEVCEKCHKTVSSRVEYNHETAWEEITISTGCGEITLVHSFCACNKYNDYDVRTNDCAFKESYGKGETATIVYVCEKCGFSYTRTDTYEENGCTTTRNMSITINGQEYSAVSSYESHNQIENIEYEYDEQGRVVKEIRILRCSECEKELERYTYTYSYEMTDYGQEISSRWEDLQTGRWHEYTYEYKNYCYADVTYTDEDGSYSQGMREMHDSKMVYTLVDGATNCEQGVTEQEICGRCNEVLDDGNGKVRYEHSYQRTTLVKGDKYELCYVSCATEGCEKANEKNYDYYGFNAEEVSGEKENGYTIFTSPDGKYVFVRVSEREVNGCQVFYYETLYFDVNREAKTYQSVSERMLRSTGENHQFEYQSNSYEKDGGRVEVHTEICQNCKLTRVTQNTYDRNGEQIGREVTENGKIVESWREERDYDEEGRVIRGVRYELRDGTETVTSEYRYIYEEDQRFETYRREVYGSEVRELTYTYRFESCQRDCVETITYKDSEMKRSEWSEEAHVFVTRYKLQGKSCEDGVIVYESCKNCGREEQREEYGGHRTYTVESYTVATNCGKNNTVSLQRCVCGQRTEMAMNFVCKFEYVIGEYVGDGLYDHWVYVYRCPVTDCGYTYSVESYYIQDKETCTQTHYTIYRFGVTYEDDISTALNNDCELKLETNEKSVWHELVGETIEESESRREYVYRCKNCNEISEREITEYDEYGRVCLYRHENCMNNSWEQHDNYVYENACEGSYHYTNSDGADYISKFSNHARTKISYREPTCTEYGYEGEYCPTCGKMFGEYAIEPGHVYAWDEEKQTYACTKCHLENKQGVDQSLIFEDKGESGRYVVSFYNKGSVVGSGSYEIHFSFITADGVNAIEELDYELERIGKCGKLYIEEYVVQNLAAELNLETYQLRVSFLYNDWTAGDYLEESITLDAPGENPVEPSECNHEWYVQDYKEGENCETFIIYACKLCSGMMQEIEYHHDYQPVQGEDGAVNYICANCGASCMHEKMNGEANEDGLIVYFCPDCGYSYTEEAKQPDPGVEECEHVYGEAKTETQECLVITIQVCEKCGYEFVDKQEKHSYEAITADDGRVSYTCSVCHKECAHEDFSEVYNEDGTLTAICQECGYVCEHKDAEIIASDEENGDLYYCGICQTKWQVKAQEQA